MTFMLNLEIDGKEAVKIEKRVCHKCVAHPLCKDKCDFISGTPCKVSKASAA